MVAFAFAFASPRRSRKPSLTPLIDVVFLLLVFFMLAARFGAEVAVPVQLAGAGGSYDGPPRLLDVAPGSLRLNGVQVSGDLAAALAPLMQTPADPVLLRARDGADVQRLLDVLERLRGAGLTGVVLVE